MNIEHCEAWSCFFVYESREFVINIGRKVEAFVVAQSMKINSCLVVYSILIHQCCLKLYAGFGTEFSVFWETLRMNLWVHDL